MNSIGESLFRNLNKRSKEMLVQQRDDRRKIELTINKIWKKPIDLLESMIRICYETGAKKNSLLTNGKDNQNMYKKLALIKIHARVIQITNENLTLIKAGNSSIIYLLLLVYSALTVMMKICIP